MDTILLYEVTVIDSLCAEELGRDHLDHPIVIVELCELLELSGKEVSNATTCFTLGSDDMVYAYLAKDTCVRIGIGLCPDILCAKFD
ncbi:hypothetical protein Cocul_00850 [Corynebacterium oculi]|uniref:Uncharacterized protein n=1 Tax=Corynebacterium oculi TaxID=1544416 RepID=A0A0Q0UCD6_9CORY|nr:hypothetical protein Cocul_00850 [Corynebacterium oculi]